MGELVDPADEGAQCKAEHQDERDIHDREFTGQVLYVEEIHEKPPIFFLLS
jgi:hypothetical protein